MRGVVSGNIGRINKAEFMGQYFLLDFSVAEKVYLGREKGTVDTWHTCKFWGNKAEGLSKNLEIGQHIDVMGQSYLETYTNQQGVEKTILCVHVSDVALGPKRNSDAGGSQGGYDRPGPDNGHQGQPQAGGGAESGLDAAWKNF